MSHTPWPWKINDYDHCSIHGQDEIGICDLRAKDGYPRKNAKYNARLIAAAPDLLEAAKAGLDLSKYMAAINWDGSQNTQEWLDGLLQQIEAFQAQATAAIANAEREEE